MNYPRTLSELQQRCSQGGRPKRLAVICAHEPHVLEAVAQAQSYGIVSPLLIGKKEIIASYAEKIGMQDYEILHAETNQEALVKMVHQFQQGNIELLMKGLVDTKDIIGTIVRKENGMGSGGLISHLAIYEAPFYHKLLALTDMAVVLSPTLEQKISILDNAIAYLNRIGIEEVNIAALAAVEHVNPKMPETVEAQQLKELCEKGRFPNCHLEGPISYDLTFNQEAAKTKRFTSPVCGNVDLLLAPNVLSGNLLGKCITNSAGAKGAGVLLGAAVPVAVTSRGTPPENKYLSILLAACS